MKKPTYTPHLLTYLFAAKYCYGKKVIDVGCGEGYGMLLLSMFARAIHGIDISENAVRIASMHKYLCPTQIEVHDLDTNGLVSTWDVMSDDVPVYVALEVLEHIENPTMLKDKGIVIFSVPFNYPHRLHKSIFVNEDQVKALFPGRHVQIWYQSKWSITQEKPKEFERYIGVVV